MKDRTEIIKNLIDETGMNGKAFADKAGIPYTTLRSILERGVEKASVVNVIKICKALGITVDELEQMAAGEREISSLSAHHDGEDWTEEELETIRKFKEFVRSQRKEEPHQG